MKSYSNYKDSGVKWLEQIPQHWEVIPFGRKFTYGKGLPITKADLTEEGESVISYGQIHSKINTGTSISENLVKKVSSDFLNSHPQCLLSQGDFVFADTSEDLEGVGACAFNDYEKPLFAGYHTVIARPYQIEYPKYFAYLFQSSSWRKMVQTIANSVKVYSITKGLLRRTYLLFPPLSEQLSIVSYLDGKVSAMDRLVLLTQQKVEHLKALKQAIIQQAVTRGIPNKNHILKQTNIKWIKQIPQHWEVKKIKYILAECTEKGFPNEPVLCSTQKYGVIPQSMYENRVVVVNKGLEGLKLVRRGDFVISLRSFQGGIEYAHYQGIISAAYTVLRLQDDVNPNYLRILFKTQCFIQLLQTCVTGIREGQNINYGLLRKNSIPLPPLSEQEEIVAYLDEKTAKIDLLIDKELQQIEHIKDLKQTLIADVVTGKVDVTTKH